MLTKNRGTEKHFDLIPFDVFKISVECSADLGSGNEFRKCVRVLSWASLMTFTALTSMPPSPGRNKSYSREAGAGVYTRDVRLMKLFLFVLLHTEFANKSGANPNSNIV